MAMPCDSMFRHGGLQTLTEVVRGRWFVFAVGILVMLVSAGAYSFSVYSQKLKTALDIDQEQLNIIADFLDFGVNLGIPAGLLCDYWSPRGVLFVGALETAVAYLLAWFSVTGRIPPSVWQMCLFIFVGGNAQAFLNASVMVQSVKLFPSCKGIIISLMKGYIGVSGAILIQVYLAIHGSTQPESFLLMLVWLPSAVAILSMLVMRPLKPFQGLPDVKYFYWFLVLGFALAFYLMAVTAVQSTTTVSWTGERVIAGVLLILVVIPLFTITYRSEVHGMKNIEEDSFGSPEGKFSLQDTAATGGEKELREPSSTLNQEVEADTEPEAPRGLKSGANDELLLSENTQNVAGVTKKITLAKISPGIATNVHTTTTTTTGEVAQPQQPHDQNDATVLETQKKAWPRRGEDHTIWQTFRTLDFWLVFVIAMIGIGSGLTATANMGQLGLSLGYSSTRVRTFVSLLSIWNSIGRWVAGFLSEILLHRYGTPRPQFHAATLVLLALSYLLVAVNLPACLYYGSILLGLSFGAQYPLVTTTIAEDFGLKFFGTLYTSIGLACPIAQYILSVLVAGKLYDVEARRQAGPAANSSDLICYGPSCFRTTFLIMMGVTVGAAAVAGLLWYRTRHFYQELHESYQISKAELKGVKELQLVKVA